MNEIIKINKFVLLKSFIISILLILVFLILEKLTGGRYADVISIVSFIPGVTIALYVGINYRPKAAYATGVGVGLVYLISIMIIWLIVGLIVYKVFGRNILDLNIDLKNLRLVWLD